jgi:hypothetical protein
MHQFTQKASPCTPAASLFNCTNYRLNGAQT